MANVKAPVEVDPGKENVRHPLDNILNFRDVGKTINDFLGEKYESISSLSFLLPSQRPSRQNN
jgi:hypothetical protein